MNRLRCLLLLLLLLSDQRLTVVATFARPPWMSDISKIRRKIVEDASHMYRSAELPASERLETLTVEAAYIHIRYAVKHSLPTGSTCFVTCKTV